MNIGVRKFPIENILVESDCPYLTPPLPSEALAKNGRNEPIFVQYIAERVAELKEMSYARVVDITTDNTRRLFSI